jgi:hypothetical protein
LLLQLLALLRQLLLQLVVMMDAAHLPVCSHLSFVLV